MKRLIILTCISLLTFSNLFAQTGTSTKLEALWYYTETPRSRESFFKHADKIDILGPQTYVLGMNGEITSYMKQDVLDHAKSKGVKVMPLLANTDGKMFYRKTIDNLLINKENWNKVYRYMSDEAKKNGYIGWQLDLENIASERGDLFTQFVKFLNDKFKQDGLMLSIAIVAKTSDNEKDYSRAFWNNWAGAYDYRALAANSDFLSIMAYDQWDSTGPVATLPWQKRVLDYTLKNVPKEKISFGIPTYGWAYRKGEKKHFIMINYPFTFTKLNHFDKSDPKNMTTGSGTSKSWGNISWVSYNQWGKNYTIWYEDKNSFKAKYDQIKDLSIRGYSAWVLGDEDPQIWDLKL